MGLPLAGWVTICCLADFGSSSASGFGGASHEACRRMAVCTRQAAGSRTRLASRGTRRATAVKPRPTGLPASSPAPYGRGSTRGKVAWLRSYRRGTTGATARRSGVASCQLNRKDRRRAMGSPAHNKCQRGLGTMLAFCVMKISKLRRLSKPTANRKLENEFAYGCREITYAAPEHPNHRHLSLSSANCGGAERR